MHYYSMKNINSKTFTYYNSKATLYGAHEKRLQQTFSLLQNISYKRVLDIGCATGYFGEILKKQGKYVVGVDVSQKAINIAKRKLDKAYALDLEQENLPKLKPFDLILLSEVIEHLFTPELTFQKLLKLLKPKGYILISTPNFLYWGNRLQLLKGDFKYSNQGVFDHGHIHFYSYKTLTQLIKENNLLLIGENHIYPSLVSKLFSKYSQNLFASHLIILCQKK